MAPRARAVFTRKPFGTKASCEFSVRLLVGDREVAETYGTLILMFWGIICALVML